MNSLKEQGIYLKLSQRKKHIFSTINIFLSLLLKKNTKVICKAHSKDIWDGSRGNTYCTKVNPTHRSKYSTVAYKPDHATTGRCSLDRSNSSYYLVHIYREGEGIYYIIIIVVVAVVLVIQYKNAFYRF